MKSYPTIRLMDPRSPADVLEVVAMIDAGEVDTFAGEIAHELGTILGVNREAARAFVLIDQRGAISLPVPDCFELSASTRRGFACDVAKLIAFALGAARSAA